MRLTRPVQIGAGLVVAGLLVWGGSRLLESLLNPRPETTAARAEPAAETAHILATLYFGTTDGRALAAVRREVVLADGVAAQGRQILLALLSTPSRPYVPVVPAGTTLRSFYTTERGDAFVDLSREVTSSHTGGSLAELLTVFAIVNAVTVNLPSVRRVQILVDGREVDTIAGHIDVRQPLAPDASLVR